MGEEEPENRSLPRWLIPTILVIAAAAAGAWWGTKGLPARRAKASRAPAALSTNLAVSAEETEKAKAAREELIQRAIAMASDPFLSPLEGFRKGEAKKARKKLTTSDRIHIEGVIWGGSPRSSFVIANGMTLGMGSKIFGAEVVSISRDVVVFREGGRSFAKPLTRERESAVRTPE